MRILVFSDSHGRVQPMLDAVDRYRPDGVFHLGDVVRDGAKAQETYPKIPFYRVAGNCDWSYSGLPLEDIVRLEGKTIFYMHGHTQSVKSSPTLAVRAAQSLGADLLLFGHTHRSLCEEYGKLLVVNPGAVQNDCGALLTWENGGEIVCTPLAL